MTDNNAHHAGGASASGAGSSSQTPQHHYLQQRSNNATPPVMTSLQHQHRAYAASNRKPPSDGDDASRAARTMAALAQAASAKHKSPAEAAEIARAHAQNMAKKQQQQSSQAMMGHRKGPGQQAPSPRPEPRKIQPVPLEAVKSVLRVEQGSSKLLEKLANGENDSFLQQLLLMEYLKDSEGAIPEGDNNVDPEQSEQWKITFACERVKFLLKSIETAYDSMQGMLPHPLACSSSAKSNASFDCSDGYGLDKEDDEPVVIPDFLPPCTSKRGDNTLEFFLACSGTREEPDDEVGTATQGLAAAGLEEVQATPIQNTREEKSVAGHSEATESTASSNNTASTSSSLFSTMFGMKRPTLKGANKPSFLSSFSKRNRRGSTKEETDGDTSTNDNDLAIDYQCEPGEYCVVIEREMLGLTVENVLERTVVRTVLEAGPAKKAGAKVGSLIVKVGNIETRNLTHFETIDELRQSQRPLVLVLRQIPEEALRAAREEMGRLIRGSGFGKIIDGEGGPSFPGNANSQSQHPDAQDQKASIQKISNYSGLIRKRWIEAVNLTPRSKKCEPVLRAGEKLIWIMTLFVVGLEREADRLSELAKKDQSKSPTSPSTPTSPRHAHSQYSHSAQDYADASKSASKVLYEFVRNRMDPARLIPPPPPPNMGGRGRGPMRGRGGRGGRGPPGRGGRGMPMPSPGLSSDKLLVQIGDVLQRMRAFLADPLSPPAAMMRGELIACLCDILDADTEMKLSEEENFSSTQGGNNAGPIADLGAAGSLLKLIVLNCPIMKSRECDLLAPEDRNIDAEEMARRCGETKDEYSSNDYHRLHAGNRFLAVVHRLAASRSTSARITACSLGPVLWSRLDFPHQLQVR